MQIVKCRGIGCTTGELSARYKKAGGSLYYFVREQDVREREELMKDNDNLDLPF